MAIFSVKPWKGRPYGNWHSENQQPKPRQGGVPITETFKFAKRLTTAVALVFLGSFFYHTVAPLRGLYGYTKIYWCLQNINAKLNYSQYFTQKTTNIRRKKRIEGFIRSETLKFKYFNSPLSSVWSYPRNRRTGIRYLWGHCWLRGETGWRRTA